MNVFQAKKIIYYNLLRTNNSFESYTIRLDKVANVTKKNRN